MATRSCHTSINNICPFTVDKSIVYTCQFGKGKKAQPRGNSHVNTCNKQSLQVQGVSAEIKPHEECKIPDSQEQLKRILHNVGC